MRRPLCVLLLAGLIACAPNDDGSARVQEEGDGPGIVDVIARDLTLEAPDRIASGWTTFRFTNTAPMVHFAVIERMPEGQGLTSHQAEVAPVFQEGLGLLGAGDMNAALAKFGELPPWFGEIVFLGGPGLTSPGQTSQTTVYLEPGTYLLECYVKTAGVFHSYNPEPMVNGMVHQFEVTAEASEAVEPTSTLQVEVSSADGIVVSGSPTRGEHIIAVQFADQTVHENFVGHDVHLVRLPAGVEPGELERWMDWTQPGGLESPAPAVFLGGVNEMPAGSTGYFAATLVPGNYVLIAEVPGTEVKGMLQAFRVPS